MNQTSLEMPICGTKSIARRKARSSQRPEEPIAQSKNGWRQLYGDIANPGVSIQGHGFELPTEFDWSRNFHPECLELCLNLEGHGSVSFQQSTIRFEPLTAGFYIPGHASLRATRGSNQKHQFITVAFSAAFLRRRLAPCDGSLHPLVEQFMQGAPDLAGLATVDRLTLEQEQLVTQLLSPVGALAARSLWFESKVLQLIVDFFFKREGEDELFCDRQKRIARERTAKVVALLRNKLADPPDLETIGRNVGCSPFYLSRTFSAEMKMTIPQYLRKLRMERAAELLLSGKYNVTEAAMEVGYSSLSHFSQAFCQTMGCCPALFPRKPSRRE